MNKSPGSELKARVPGTWLQIKDFFTILLLVHVRFLHKLWSNHDGFLVTFSNHCYTEIIISNLKSRDGLNLIANTPDEHHERFEVKTFESYGRAHVRVNNCL